VQPVNAPPRDELTRNQVIALIQGAETVTYETGVDLMDVTQTDIEALGEDFEPKGSDIKRDITAELHSGGKIQTARELEWGVERIRPWYRIAAHTRVDDIWQDLELLSYLGIYLLDTPTRSVGGVEKSYSVDVFDKLSQLNTSLGNVFEVDDVTPVLTYVTDLIEAMGEMDIKLDPSKADVPHPTGRFWDIRDDVTVLKIVNELLEAIGYSRLSMDYDGFLVSDPTPLISQLPQEWNYSLDDSDSILGIPGDEKKDYFDMPNVWRFIVDDAAGELPDEGDGLYTVMNQSTGSSSIDSRGREVYRIVSIDAVDQESLVTKGDRFVQDDGRSRATFTCSIGPNPLHWGHPDRGDIVRITAEEFEIDALYEVQKWSLPLDGGDMKFDQLLRVEPLL
jgi:hypothetical protein